MQVPETPRCIAYCDAQWMFRTAKFMFDMSFPSFNPKKLAEIICTEKGFKLEAVKLYVDVPDFSESQWWSSLWKMRIEDLEKQGIITWHTASRVRQALCVDDPSKPHKVYVKSDMETTVRITSDITRDVVADKADVILLMSKEHKYVELTEALRAYAREHGKWLKLATTYPHAKDRDRNSHAGIDRTDWYPINRDTYMQCTDFVRRPASSARKVEEQKADEPNPSFGTYECDVTEDTPSSVEASTQEIAQCAEEVA